MYEHTQEGIEMKKSIVLTVLLLVAVVFTGGILCACNDKVVSITGHSWAFNNIQSGETGEIIYCSAENQDIFPNAKVANVSCKVSDRQIVIKNNISGEEWKFAYEEEKTISHKDALYIIRLTGGTVQGRASVGITEYADGSSEYTLIITFNNVNIYFKEPIVK